MNNPPAQRKRRSRNLSARHSAEHKIEESMLDKRDAHYSIQFNAPDDLVEISQPPSEYLPSLAYVYEPLASGQGITIYSLDTGVNTESEVRCVDLSSSFDILKLEY